MNRVASLIGLVGIGLVIALFAFGAGRLTAPADEPAAAISPTSTTMPLEVAVGVPLAWEETGDVGEMWPIALVEYDNTLYLFGTSAAPFGFPLDEPAGLEAWASTDGTSWESLGSVIAAPAGVQNVVSTPRGLMAVGASGSEGTPMVWTSTDGETWSASELPLAVAPQLTSETFMQAAGANDAVFVVFGQTYNNPDRMLFDAIPDEFRDESGQPYGFGFGGPPFTVTIYGPLGIVVHELSADDLGLTEEQVTLLTGGGGMEEELITQWTSADGVSWTASQVEGGGVQRVWTGSDGTLVASAWGFAGPETWTSADGLEWEREAAADDLDVRGPWSDGVVASRYYGPGEQLVYSSDAQEWISLEAEAVLPENLSWSYYPVALGGRHIALIANGYDEFMDMGFDQPEPIVLERDGYTLTIDESRGSLVLGAGSEEVLSLFLHTERIHEEIDADLRAGTLTFVEPETGEALVTFTFEEVDEAQQAVYGAFEQMGREQQVFMLYSDGVGWTAHDADGAFGSDGGVWELLVARDLVVAAVAIEGVEAFIGPPQTPTVKIWTAPVR